MDELQTWWEIPCIGQYVSLFRFDFKLPEMDLEELEEGLIADGSPGGSPILENLIVSLIRGYYPRAGVNEDNWEFHLKRLLQKKWVKEEGRSNPLQGGTSFNKITLREKVEVLHSICYYRLESADVPDLIKTMDADSLRVQSLGCDDIGNVYWYFYGTRLYKEEPSDEKKKDWKEEWKQQKKQSFGEKKRRGRPRKCKPIKSDGESEESEENENKNYMNLDGKSRWSVVCTTLEEWVDFTEKYKNSQSKREMALFKLLSTNFLPHLNEMYEEKEKRLRQKIMQLIPRRISRRIETRKRTRSEMRRSDLNESNGNISDDDLRNQAYEKERMSRDRAQRLEERNQRRISEQINRSRTRSTSRKSHRSSYADSRSNSIADSFENSEEEEEEEVVYRPELPRTSSTGKDDMRFKIHKVITEVKMCKDAWPFLYPVDESYAPGYNDIITEPMDLSTIENKLITGVYKSLSQVDNDFRKMVMNCQTYNGEKNEFSTMAITLWRIFRKGISQLSQPKPATPEPVATQSSPCDQNERETSLEQSSNDATTSNDVDNESEAPTLKTSAKRKRKKKATPGMKGLDMLLKASEMALKNVRREDSSSYSDSSSDTYYKPTSSFSDLNIVPIHSHNASKPNSPQQINNGHSSAQASADQQTQYDADEMQDQSYDSPSAPLNISQNYSEGSYNDSNSPQNVTTSNDNFNSSNVSNTVDIVTSDQDNMASYNGHRESQSNLLNTVDNQISSILAECNNDNMTNLLTKFIKDNQSIMDSQNGSIPSVQDINTSNANNLSLSPRLDPSLKVSNSPPNTSQMYSSQTTVFQDGLDLQLGLENYQPSADITTVDASAIGISNFYPRETNGNNQYQNIYGNQVDDSKKPATVASLLAATEKTIVSSPTSRKQRCSPIYVTVNANQPNLVSLAPNFGQSSSEVTGGNVKFMPEYANQQSNLVQTSVTQLGNVSVPAPDQNFIIQDANSAATTSVSSTSLHIPEAFNKLCSEQNTNTFLPNQLSPRQIAVSNGQIMIITQNSAQQSTNMPATLNFLQPNATGASYQQHMYNSGIRTQVSPPAVAVENQNNATALKQLKKINSTRPPKKRSPMIEQLTVSPQISPTTTQPPICNATCNTINNITYSQPMQVYSSPPNSRPKLPNVHSSPELNRNSVIMSNMTQSSPTCSSQNVIFTNGGTINSTSQIPTYVSSSGNNLYSTIAAQQQMPVMQRMANYNSNNHILGTVPFMPKVPVQNGVKRFKPASIIKNKNGQYIVIAATKDNVSNQVMASSESYTQLQQNFSNCISKNNAPIRSDAPQFININNTLLQTMPIQGFPLKTAPMISEVPSNQLTQFINIPHYMVATQSPTMIQQSPIYTQTVNSTNQNQQSMENR